MKITKAALRIITSLLCAVLIFNGLPLNAAGPSEELRHEAFLRGGKAISAALNASETTPAISKAIEESMPTALPAPTPAPAPPPVPQTKESSSGMSKWLWISLIGGFTATGIIVYHVANSPGASVRNCSTCQK